MDVTYMKYTNCGDKIDKIDNVDWVLEPNGNIKNSLQLVNSNEESPLSSVTLSDDSIETVTHQQTILQRIWGCVVQSRCCYQRKEEETSSIFNDKDITIREYD